MPIMQLTVEIPDFAMNGMVLDSFSVTVDPKGGVRLKGMLERVAGFRSRAPSYVKGTLRAGREPGIVCVDYCPIRPDFGPADFPDGRADRRPCRCVRQEKPGRL